MGSCCRGRKSGGVGNRKLKDCVNPTTNNKSFKQFVSHYQEEKMKKIIGVIFLGTCLCAGSAFAGSTSSNQGQGGGTHPLLDDERGFFGSAAVDIFENTEGSQGGTHPLLDDERGFFGSAAIDIFDNDADEDDDFPGQGRHYGTENHQPSAVPLPGTVLLLGSGVAGLFFMRRNNVNKA